MQGAQLQHGLKQERSAPARQAGTQPVEGLKRSGGAEEGSLQKFHKNKRNLVMKIMHCGHK